MSTTISVKEQTLTELLRAKMSKPIEHTNEPAEQQTGKEVLIDNLIHLAIVECQITAIRYIFDRLEPMETTTDYPYAIGNSQRKKGTV